jgi:hypothetical protein
MDLGSSRTRRLALALAAAALLGLAAGCGEEEHSEVVEGEPLELGDVHYNVQLTRFLNPTDREDSEYLEGLPRPPAGQEYLGVFLEVENQGDEPATLPSADELVVTDTTGQEFEPIETDTVFGLELGETIGPDEEAPLADTAAAAGPVQGALVVFLVDEGVSENRPLELTIAPPGEEGRVELDI